METRYDIEEDILTLVDKTKEYDETIGIEGDFTLDIDKQGKIFAIDVSNASIHFGINKKELLKRSNAWNKKVEK